MKKALNIALLGYGKMGKAIAEIAPERGHAIVCSIDNEADWKRHAAALEKADVAIEFSTPHTAVSNIQACLDRRLPVVVGTTGWLEQMEPLQASCRQQGGALIWAANYSVGMNIFLKLSSYLARLMKPFDAYEAKVHEVHHTQKLDAPSGTAIAIAHAVEQGNAALAPWHLVEAGEQERSHGLPISYARQGDVFGEHYLKYSSAADTVGLSHKANSRRGFAEGALIAAEYIYGKQGFFNFADLFES